MKKYLNTILTALLMFASTSCAHKVTGQDAFIMSKELVGNAVKSQGFSDVSFPFADYRFDDIKQGGYIVESYFTMKNEHNVKVKVKYRAKVRYEGGKWSDVNSWKLEDLRFIN